VDNYVIALLHHPDGSPARGWSRRNQQGACQRVLENGYSSARPVA